MENSSNSTNSQEIETFNSFSFQHLLIIIFVAAAMIFLSFSLIQLRIRIKNNMIERIPRKIMPFLRPGDLSNKQRTIILNEIVKSKEIQLQTKPTILVSPIGHLGWGNDGSNTINNSMEGEDSKHYNIHFKTFMIKSWIILESAASHYNQSLKRPLNLCIREYIELLVNECLFLNKVQANLYIETYEKARFSNDEFTEQEYTEFKENFGNIISSFENASLSKKRLVRSNTNNNNIELN